VLKADLEGLSAAASVVATGGVICYPTDTVYGLGCNPFNPNAVQRIMQAKGDRTKPMPVLVRSPNDAEKLAILSSRARKLAQKFWPGPLTIVAPAKPHLPAMLAPEGTVGVRAPNHPVCLHLLGLCSGFLVGTSANLTGRGPATSALEVESQLGDRVDLILDGGRSPLGVPSTVVDMSRGRAVLLREGPISRKEILASLRTSKRR